MSPALLAKPSTLKVQMRLLVACEHRFILISDGSRWAKVTCDYSFGERYLSA